MRNNLVAYHEHFEEAEKLLPLGQSAMPPGYHAIFVSEGGKVFGRPIVAVASYMVLNRNSCDARIASRYIVADCYDPAAVTERTVDGVYFFRVLAPDCGLTEALKAEAVAYYQERQTARAKLGKR